MENMVTLPSITDRILTTTEEYTAPTNSLILFNGNDITIGGAMTTRVLLSRIISEIPYKDRTFAYPLLFSHVIEHRPALVAAVLTALRAWLVHGKPNIDPKVKRDAFRFPQWDSLIAQALVWYGYADPVRGGDELREVDPVKEAKREVVRQWAAAFGGTMVSALDLQKHHAVRGAIASAKRKHEREITSMVVGHFVSNLEGGRLDLEWKVIRGKKVAGHAAEWFLDGKHVEPTPPDDVDEIA